MKLRALVIGYPGEKGNDDYCEGVNQDLKNYPVFLTSARGGSWQHHEIEILRAPSLLDVRTAIKRQEAADYSMTIFCGHGYVQGKSTFLDLKLGVAMDSNEVRVGGPKHTLIIDCCRKKVPSIITEVRALDAAIAKADSLPKSTRLAFESKLDNCPPGLVVLFACAVGETAGDDAGAGGRYSSSLLEVTSEWAAANTKPFSTQAATLSIVGAHDLAIPKVKSLSGNRQNPPPADKPRSQPYFPFGIVA